MNISENRSRQIAWVLISLIFSLVTVLSIAAQVVNRPVSIGDLSFEVPSAWRVTDKSTDQVGQLNIVPDTGNVLIIVSTYKKRVSQESEFSNLKEQIAKPRQGKIAQNFSMFTENSQCIEVSNKKIPGASISGMYGQQPTTSSSFSFIEKGRFVHLVYLREDRESATADAGWQTILKTLRVGDSNKSNEGLSVLDSESGEMLNGRAISLPKPSQPPDGGPGLGLSTTVVVRVVIDTNGDVISAKPVSGIQRFFPPALAAAKKAKFSPTRICGELSTVSGTINYVFRNE